MARVLPRFQNPQSPGEGRLVFPSGKATVYDRPTGDIIRTEYPGAFAPSGNIPTVEPYRGNNNQGSSGGGDSRLDQLSKTNRNPSQEAEYRRLLELASESQRDVNAEIDSAFGTRIGRLNEISGRLQSLLPGIESDIQNQFGTQKSVLEGQKATGEREIGEAETQAGQRKEDAVTAARRLYNELQRGALQRFGGATSAGQAFTELSNVEQQRSAADIQRNYDTALRELQTQKQALSERYNTSLLQLQTNRDGAINEARRNLQNQLIEVDRMKDAAEQDKSNRRIAALQDYRNTVFQIELQTQEMRRSLDSQAQSDAGVIDNHAQNLQQSLSQTQNTRQSFFENTTPNPTSGLSDVRSVTGGAGLSPSQSVGAISPLNDEEDIGPIGRISSFLQNPGRSTLGFLNPF